MTKCRRTSDQALVCGLDSSELVWSPMTRLYVHGNILTGYIPYQLSGT